MLRRTLPLTLLLLTGCPRDEVTPDEYVVPCDLADAGQASTSDENYIRFVEAEAAGRSRVDPCLSPELVSPAPGGTLDPRNPPTFTFNPSHPSCARPLPAGGTLGCRMPPPPSLAGRALALAGSLLVGTAEAHCPAFTGENYLLRLTVEGEERPLYTAMLSVTSYTPAAQVWRSALSGRSGQTVRLTIARGVFLRGNLNEGPFVQPQPYTWTVAP